MSGAVFGVGMALLRQQGVPEHVARQAMLEDPECYAIAATVEPVLRRLVERLTELMPQMTALAAAVQPHANDPGGPS